MPYKSAIHHGLPVSGWPTPLLNMHHAMVQRCLSLLEKEVFTPELQTLSNEVSAALDKFHRGTLGLSTEPEQLLGPALNEQILRQAIQHVTLDLNALVGACIDPEGKPRAPDKAALARARRVLPAHCAHSFKKAQT